jgi:hypothetical protein
MAQSLTISIRKSFDFNATARLIVAPLVPYSHWGIPMIDLQVHPGIHVEEQFQRPECSTCRACHRSFRAKSEDQLSGELCDHCFEAAQHPEPAIPTVHVKVLPRRNDSL